MDKNAPYLFVLNYDKNPATLYKSTHQPHGGEHVVIVSHEVHLPDGSQRLLLRQLPWALRQVEPLAPNAYCSTRNDNDIEACRWQQAFKCPISQLAMSVLGLHVV